MRLERVDISKQVKLLVALDKYCRTIQRRGTTYSCHAQSEHVASINLIITGRKGTAQKTLVVVYDKKEQFWNVFCEGYKYELDNLGEIASIMRSMVARVTTIVSRL